MTIARRALVRRPAAAPAPASLAAEARDYHHDRARIQALALAQEEEYQSFRARIRIDRAKLETNIEEQAQVYLEVCERQASAGSMRDKARDDLARKDADLARTTRARLAQEGGKTNDSIINDEVMLHQDHVAYANAFDEAKRIADKWGALAKAFEQRMRMLRELVSLYNSGYWTTAGAGAASRESRGTLPSSVFAMPGNVGAQRLERFSNFVDCFPQPIRGVWAVSFLSSPRTFGPKRTIYGGFSMGNLIRRPAAAAARGAPRTGFKFNYTRPTPEQVRERATRPIGGRDSYFKSEVQFFTAREGTNTIRFLPPPPDADWGGHYGFPITVHYDIGADGSAYLCRSKMLGEPCAICDERRAANASNEEELVKALKPGSRVACYVIDRKDEAKGVQLWNLADGVDKDVTKICVDASTGEVIFPEDPDNGYDLTFTREGTGLKTKYKGLVFSRRESPLTDDPKNYEAWLKYVVDNPINTMLLFHDTEYVQRVLSGQPTGGAPAAAAEDRPAAAAPVERKQPLARRGAPSAPQPAPQPEPQPEDAAPPPTWDELAAMNETDMGALVDEFQLGEVVPANGFGSDEELRTWLADQLQIEVPQAAPPPPPPARTRTRAAAAPAQPAPAAAAPAAGNWRDRVKALGGAGK